MIQTFTKYSFTVVLTMLIALNMDIPLRGSLESFNPVEREPVRGSLLQEDQIFIKKTKSRHCTQQPPFVPGSIVVPVSQTVSGEFQRAQSLFLLHRTLRL